MIQLSITHSTKNFKEKPLPPGRVKITQALKSLLENKEFSAITTAEISRKAGVTEALIYKYFLIVGIFICPQGLGLIFSSSQRKK
jgi:hypothetical protein